MGSRDEEREFSKVGRDRLLRLVSGLRKERDAAYVKIRILESALNDCHVKLNELVEVVATMKEADSARLADGLLLKGWMCKSCGVFNSEEKEHRPACRSCGSARRK